MSELRCMSDSAVSMEGYHPHKMDPKGRVAIPVDWRPAPGTTLRLISAEREGLPVIQVLPEAEYQKRLAEVDAHATATPAQKRVLKGRLYTYNRKAEVSSQGKLLVPKDWSEAANLPTEDYVMLVGKGSFFEIWNNENFAQLNEREMAKLGPLREELGIC